MNVPPVQYLNTSDGVSIAYNACGEGEPFVFLPTFLNHVQHMWRLPSLTPVLTALAEQFRLVTYDARGMGMSSRGLPDNLTLEAYFRDLDAVVERLKLDRFVLLGSCNFALMAAHYAAEHPARVSALVLVNGAMSWNASALPAFYDELPAQDWEMFLYNLIPRDRTPEQSRMMLELLKDSMTQSDYLTSLRVWQTAGLETVLPRLHTPTLVLHPRYFHLRAADAAIELARRLPGSRLALMESAYLFGNPGQAMQVIESFLDDLRAVNEIAVHTDNGSPAARLSERESEVLRMVASGMSNREIASALVLSVRTVERHIANLYAKTGAHTKAQATAYALRQGVAQKDFAAI